MEGKAELVDRVDKGVGAAAAGISGEGGLDRDTEGAGLPGLSPLAEGEQILDGAGDRGCFNDNQKANRLRGGCQTGMVTANELPCAAW